MKIVETYDPSQMRWEQEKWSFFSYIPKHTGRQDAAARLVLDFKRGRVQAVNFVTTVVLESFRQREQLLRDDYRCRYILALPKSRAGVPNQPCEDLCAALAAQFSWLTHLPGALKRLVDVPKSATAAKEGRPRTDFLLHATTICYDGPPLDASSLGIILVDDIITTGAQSDACYGIIRDATRCERILSVFVARRIWSNQRD